jgi:hypothetical protein
MNTDDARRARAVFVEHPPIPGLRWRFSRCLFCAPQYSDDWQGKGDIQGRISLEVSKYLK